MSWVKIHEEWFKSESEQLKNNTNYKEKFRYLDNLFVSCGEIIVRLKETKRYPVLIIYPKSTPYSPPLVYILKELLDDNEIKKISSLVEDKLYNELKDKVKFIFLRHQNYDGRVCIVESDNLYKEEPQIYQIKDIIKRIRDWLISIETGKIPFDYIEVELFSHFKDKTYDLRVLLPDIFYDENITEGDFYAVFNKITFLDKKLYIGIYIIGQNISGISIPPRYYRNFKYLLYSTFPDLDKIFSNTDKVKKLLEKGELIKGFWWDVNIEPEPFQKTEKIAFYIGNGDLKKGLVKIFNRLVPEKAFYNNIYVGLRFLNRKGEAEPPTV